MLKLGKMRALSREYNIFMLNNKNIVRLEIGDPASMWHSMESNILYGEYSTGILKTYGDAVLGKLFKDTVRNAKNIKAPEQISVGWDGGAYFKNTFKQASAETYYGRAEKSGRLCSEVYRYDGVKIEIIVYDENCGLGLEPLNSPEYKKIKRLKKEPETKNPAGEYANCLYLAALFKELFKLSARSDIDLDSPEALRNLLYGELRLPVLVREKSGAGSVDAKAIRKLAGMKRAVPSISLKCDIKDKYGRIVIEAEVLNAARYPETVYLEKYRFYRERAGRLLLKKQ